MKVLFVVKTVDFIDPLGLMLLSALARRAGHDTDLAILERDDVLRTVAEQRPAVVAYSASTGEHKYYLEFNQALKRRHPEVETIMGGPHATFFPEILEGSSLDALCVGEGDEAFPEFLAAVAAGKGFEGIANIGTRQSPRPELRPLFQELDSLPFPDRDLYYRRTEMAEFPLKSFMASRGCPYPCTYCFNHAFRKMYEGKGKVVRRHSVDHVLEEIRQVRRRYPLECVKFYDDIFVYRVDPWLEEFAERYPREVGLPFHCLTRADLVTEDVVRLLKAAGCHSVSMSIEAGNDRIRNEVLKRKMGREQIVSAFALFHRQGIHTFSNNILGLPGSTIADDIETLDLNIRCQVTFAEFPVFHPYPRTELGDHCVEEGWFDGGYEALHMSYQTASPLSCFTDEEKNMQVNLSELGLLAVWFPRLRNLIVNRLIRLPHNRLYFLAYFAAKAWLVSRKIYPFHASLSSAWRLLRKSLRLESFKHVPEAPRDPR
ncbi:MAG: radical SAM protein [Thermodesulfobacteriota bacterium]